MIGIAAAGVGAYGAGIAAYGLGVKLPAKILNNGSASLQINPFNYPKIGMNTTGYGKRGIDSNNLNTQNLVQQMHQNRRKF
jgi:hypothetical protein